MLKFQVVTALVVELVLVDCSSAVAGASSTISTSGFAAASGASSVHAAFRSVWLQPVRKKSCLIKTNNKYRKHIGLALKTCLV